MTNEQQGEQTPLGETLAAAVAEAAADLPVRRAAVKAEVLSLVAAEADERMKGGTPALPWERDDNTAVMAAMERHFLGAAADNVNVLVELAMRRGAGVVSEEAVQETRDPEQQRPPSTPESLGGAE